MSEIGENLTTENPNKTVREKYLRRISFNLEGFPGDTGETRDFSSILAAIDNPIRGTITRLAETDFFSDILEAKVESLWQIGMYLSMYYDKDAYDCLWQCAISNDPGLEINSSELFQSGFPFTLSVNSLYISVPAQLLKVPLNLEANCCVLVCRR